MATVFASGLVVTVVSLAVAIGLIVLNVVALVKIVTKAGYSGAWILVVFVPILVWIITTAIVYSDYHRYSYLNAYASGFDAQTFVWAWLIDGAAYLVPWIFFFTFAFSDWPNLKELRTLRAGVANSGMYSAPTPQHLGQDSMPVPSPSPVPPVGQWGGWSSGTVGTAADQARSCSNCGRPVEVGAGFCGTCGFGLVNLGPA